MCAKLEPTQHLSSHHPLPVEFWPSKFDSNEQHAFRISIIIIGMDKCVGVTALEIHAYTRDILWDV